MAGALSGLAAAGFVGLLAVAEASAQQEVAGTVVQAGTERPLAGVQVLVEGTDLGTLTDNRGRFQIDPVPGTEVTLRALLIGYHEAEATVEVGGTDIVIELSEQAIALDGVVVTGTAGDRQARAIGNVVGRLDAAEVRELAQPRDIQDMLSAQVPGVRIMRTGGEVGTGGISRIRGAASLTLPATPLVYVDGVRVDGDDVTGGIGTFAFRGSQGPSRINDLNPEDIESIEVIKGPSAATLYGTEAANGVIHIITRRGAEGAPQVNLRMREGAYWLPDPVTFFPPTYYRCSGVSQEAGVDPMLQCNEGEITPVRVLQLDRDLHGMEWFRTGRQPALGADVQGGTETVRYFFSADYNRDEGYVPYNWRRRLAGRANLSYTPSTQFNFEFSMGATRSRAQSSSTQQPLSTAVIWSCPSPGCEAGSGLPNALDGPFRGYIAYLPEAYENEIEGFQDVDRVTGGLTIEHRPLEWLDHRVTLGGEFSNIRDTDLHRATGNLGNFNNQGLRRVGHTRTTQATIDYAANARWDVSPNVTLNTSAGAQYYDRRQEASRAHGEEFAVEALETVTSGAIRRAWEDFIENRTFGVYVQEQVNWRDRVYLTAAVRGDDNSAFGEDFDFVTYPKFSASWVTSEESFMAGLDWLSTLRLRGAWGRSGQQPDAFDAIRTYQPVIGIGGAPVLTPENIGNPDLSPEVGEEIEFGFEASILEDRISMEFTRYLQRTKDALVRVPALPSLGFPGVQFQNLGEIRNQGIEFGMNTRVYESPTVRFDLGFTLSSTESEVVDLGDQDFVTQSASIGQFHVEGFPLASIFRKRVVDAELVRGDEPGDNTVRNIMCEGGERIPGTDFSPGGGPPVPCEEAPQVYWGQPLPKWEGSVDATLTLFENLRLYGLVDFIHGRMWLDGDVRSAHTSFLNTRAAIEREDPILVSYMEMGAEGRAQPGLMSGDFAKLRTVSLQYRFPESWAARLNAQRLSVTASMENVSTLWRGDDARFGHPSMDPERAQQLGGATPGLSAFNQEGWPTGKRFTTTLRVSF